MEIVMDWLSNLFEEKPKTNLEKKGGRQQEVDFRASTLGKIKRAKVKTKEDVLKLSTLIGSYVGKDTERDDISNSVEGQYIKGIIIALDNMVFLPLKKEAESLERGTDEWDNFYKENTPEVTEYLKQVNNIANALKDPKIQDAMVRVIVRYDFNFGKQSLLGKKNVASFKQRYNLDFFNQFVDEKHLNKVVNNEIRRVYLPSVFGYGLIAIGATVFVFNIFKKGK